jgi:CHAT domain-containing protein/Tfp pilus assembly protein PilF
MKQLVVVLLLLGTCSCADRTDAELEDALKSATRAMRRGELDAAETLADQGIALTRAAPNSESAWPFVLLRGEILIRKRELPAALELLQAAPPEGPSFEAIRARHEFLNGLAHLVQGRLAEGLETFERASRIAPSAQDVQLDIGAFDGQIRYLLGRPEEADARLTAVLEAATAQGDRYHQALALLHLGMGRLTRSRYDDALPWFERILTLNDLADFEIYATAVNNAGICHFQLGQIDQAIVMHERAMKLHERGSRRVYEQALGRLGTTYVEGNRQRMGLPYLQQALNVAKESGLTADAAVWAGNLASANIDLGEWEEAERFNEEARRLKAASRSTSLAHNTLYAAEIASGRGQLQQAVELFDEVLSVPEPDPSVRWSAHAGLASVAIARKQPAVAARHFETALETIEKTRAELLKIDYKLSFLTRRISFYRAYVDALVDEGQIARALEVSDSSRGRVLAERQGVAPPARVAAAAFQRLARQTRTVFLSYWLGPLRSYGWVVHATGVQLVSLPPAKEIETLVAEYRSVIDNALADPLKAESTAGDRLFQALVQPFSRWIPAGSSVIVVPDGALHGLNLETLPVPGQRRRYWIEDVEIQVAPSLALLGRAPATPARPERSLLLIGNPVPRDPEYPALRYASAEMTNVARHIARANVVSYDGAQASPAAYRNVRPDRFSFVHFTAHAAANVESPLDSAVILAGPDGAFKLYARDVADQRLQAELVTVSACRSAGGRAYSGEGLVGFAWAFLRAGSRRVIAGLWDVDDRSTAELMGTLYQQLAAGQSVAGALREAKLLLMQRGGQFARPYYWGPFELFTVTP